MDRASFTGPEFERVVHARFVGTDNGRDHFELTDQRSGGNTNFVFSLYIKMNGRQYSCTQVRVGE